MARGRLFLNAIGNFFGGLGEFLSKAGLILSCLLLFFSTFLLIAFTATQISAATGQLNIPLFNSTTRSTLALVGVDVSKIKAVDYPNVLSTALGAIAVLVTLWYTMAAAFAFSKHRRDLRKKALIQEVPVWEEGVDDLNAMHKYYKGAASVVVFSGNFSWLIASSATQPHPLLGEIDRLLQAGKIKFVSYKTEANIQQCLGARFSTYKPHFMFNSGVKLKCSLIEKGQRKVLIYMADTTVDPDGAKKVCVISGRDEAQYLLDTIDALCKKYKP